MKNLEESPWAGLPWVLVLALCARLPALLLSHGAAFDMESYGLAARHFLDGDLYAGAGLAGRYPYLPGWILVLLPLFGLSKLGLPPGPLFKLPSLAGDLGITALIYVLSLRLGHAKPGSRSGRAAFWAALAYAANPVAVLLGAAHGQFDSLPLCLILLAVYFLEFSDHPGADRSSALCLAAAALLKTWPLFFLPVFLKNLGPGAQRWKWAAWCLGPLALACLPFAWHEPGPFFRVVAGYQGAPAFSLAEFLHGLAYAGGLPAAAYARLYLVVKACLLAGLALCWLAYGLGPWRLALLPGLLMGVLTLYVFMPAFSAQYFLWLLPFAILTLPSLALRHTLYAMALLLIFYLAWMPEAFLTPAFPAYPNPARWFFVFWAVANLGLWVTWLRPWVSLLKRVRRLAA